MTKFNKKIKSMSTEALGKILKDLEAELLFDNSNISRDGKPKREQDFGKMKFKKRNIARIKTELSSREEE
jgi:ribosomal protein L29